MRSQIPKTFNFQFAAQDIIADYWTLPIDADRGTVAGPRTRLMHNSASERHLLSRDGTTMLFCSRRAGNSDIWRRDLVTGREISLVMSPAEEHILEASADAASFVYFVNGAPMEVFLGTTSGAAPCKLCDDCGVLALTPDAAKMLYFKLPDTRVAHLMDIASGQSTPLLSMATAGVGTVFFSPDSRWVVFANNRRLLAAPVQDTPVTEQDWTRINARAANYQWAGFSPSGEYFFYASNEDGRVCLYTQRLSALMPPVGEPVAIAHLHEGNTLTHPHGMSVGADKLTLLLNQGSSNIWMMHVGR